MKSREIKKLTEQKEKILAEIEAEQDKLPKLFKGYTCIQTTKEGYKKLKEEYQRKMKKQEPQQQKLKTLREQYKTIDRQIKMLNI